MGIENWTIRLKKYLIAFSIGCLGGWVFTLIRLPLPWTLGPLFFIGVAKVGLKQALVWPTKIRDIAMAVLGYSMGRSFTPETGQQLFSLLPSLMIVTLISVALCLFGGGISRRYTGLSLSTSLFGSMPGGLTQMATFCESMEDTDEAAVTLMQTVRVITVVFLVPFVALHGIANRVEIIPTTRVPLGSMDILTLVGFAVVIAILIYLSRYVKVPGKYILPPIVGTAALTLSGVHAPGLPPFIISLAQVCVGIRLGMSFDGVSLANWKKTVFTSLISVIGVIIALLGLDFLLAQLTSTSFLTAFIATAPGGMTEMGLTAMIVNADLPTVVAFQLFRLLFVYLVTMPLVSWWIRRRRKSKKIKKIKK